MSVRLSDPSVACADPPFAAAAFCLGEVCEQDGDLEQAVQWFREAAEAGHADARLRLGELLGRLADARMHAGDSERLLAEASRWLSSAPGATTLDGIGMVTAMLDRHHRQAARRGGDGA